MIINFEKYPRALWHHDCKAGSSPMKVVSHAETSTLMECVRCKKQGRYPVGRSGCIEVNESQESLTC